MIGPSRVLLLTRSGCHLCVEAERVVRDACEEHGAGWRSVDVDSDEALRSRYTDHVPVTFVDQKLLSYWFVDPTALRGALAEPVPTYLPDEWTPPLDDQH